MFIGIILVCLYRYLVYNAVATKSHDPPSRVCGSGPGLEFFYSAMAFSPAVGLRLVTHAPKIENLSRRTSRDQKSVTEVTNRH